MASRSYRPIHAIDSDSPGSKSLPPLERYPDPRNRCITEKINSKVLVVKRDHHNQDGGRASVGDRGRNSGSTSTKEIAAC